MMPSYLAAALPSKVITTWLPSASTELAGAPKVSFQRPALSMPGYSFWRFIVNATSSAVKSSPSLHVTPSRMSSVSLSPPSHVAPVASHGVSSQVRLLRTMSGS